MSDTSRDLLRKVKRRTLSASTSEKVEINQCWNERSLPVLIESPRGAVDAIDWVGSNRALVRQLLDSHGAVLFRGFEVDTAARFADVMQAFSPRFFAYRERSSPRTPLGPHVYTSTDYPCDQRILLHNENSYAATWPMYIAFFCLAAPVKGGETPITDVRRVLHRLDSDVVAKFADSGVLYVRNFRSRIGLPWQTVFQTDTKSEVEAFLVSHGYRFEWQGDDQLRTRRIGTAVSRHPRTGDRIWFNHAAFFHISALPPEIAGALLNEYGKEDLPNNTYYGDDGEISPDLIRDILAAYESESVSFTWRRNDLLLLDNMLCAHGRAPYYGERRIAAAMAEPTGAVFAFDAGNGG